jgi:hypothetical protein
VVGQDLVFGLQKELVLAMATGLFLAVALVLCIRDMRQRGSLPYVWAWIVRGGIVIVALWTQLLQGATYSLALAGGQLLSALCIVVAVLMLQPRMGRLDRTEWLTIVVASCGVAWWVSSGNPLYGLLGVILADTCATCLGVRAAVQKGTEESIPFWTCSLMAAAMALLAAGDASWGILLAPVFSCLNATTNIITVMYVRRRRQLAATQMEVEAEAT